MARAPAGRLRRAFRSQRAGRLAYAPSQGGRAPTIGAWSMRRAEPNVCPARLASVLCLTGQRPTTNVAEGWTCFTGMGCADGYRLRPDSPVRFAGSTKAGVPQ
jgi:hypothetical protein